MVVMMAACSPSGPRTVDYPWINCSNTSTIDITKVELTDSATILSVKATFQPHYWIRIAANTHLVADGKEYAMTAAEGIDPGEQFWMPDSGEAEFKLFFEPLPYSTKSFDFIEGNEEGAFRMMDVDITGNKVAEYPEGVPGEFKKKAKACTVPDPSFEMGKTTINFYLRPYYPDMGSTGSVYVNTMAGEQQDYSLKFNEEGNATLSFDQYGSAEAIVVYNNYSVGHLTLDPGETVDCYLDARITGSRAMGHRDTPKTTYKRSIHNGKFADFDRTIEENPLSEGCRLNIYGGDFGDYRMTGEEYKNMVKECYDAISDSINNSDGPQVVKDYYTLELQNYVLEAMADYRWILSTRYRIAKDNDWSKPVPMDSVPAKLEDKDYEEVVGWFDISNPKLLMTRNHLGEINWNAYGAPGDLSKSIGMFRQMSEKAKKQTLTEADLDSLKTLSNPFFAVACDSILQRTKRRYIELQKNASVLETPQVADDKVFDAIVSPHKGKVVVVDLWNTWCGPCRNALRINEPSKSEELADDDIVWIYIADESSDAVKYLEMIPDIKGLHYKVNSDQIKAIRNHFNVDGIPYYIIVDRQGNAEGRPDIRDHSLYVKAIKSKL